MLQITKKHLTPINESTKEEITSRKISGCEMISFESLANELDNLGYKLIAKNVDRYVNAYNAIVYKASPVEIIEKDTKLSFANIHARKDNNFEKLQSLRRSGLFAVKNGYIIDL